MKSLVLVLFSVLSFSNSAIANDELKAIMQGLSQAGKELGAAIAASDADSALKATQTSQDLVLGAYGVEPDKIAALEDPILRSKTRIEYKKLMLKVQIAFLEMEAILIDKDFDGAKNKTKEIVDLRKLGHSLFIE